MHITAQSRVCSNECYAKPLPSSRIPEKKSGPPVDVHGSRVGIVQDELGLPAVRVPGHRGHVLRVAGQR